jgi:hypothetical protein
MHSDSPPPTPARVQGLLRMEPTGIEPVTSCLQSGTADLLYGPMSRRVRGIVAPVPSRGYGGTRLD